MKRIAGCPIKRGLILGSLVGSVVSSCYATLVLTGMGVYLLMTNLEGVRLEAAVLGLAVLPVCGAPFALILAVLPGTLIGAFVGLVIGLMLTVLKRAAPGAGLVIGLGAGGIIVAAANMSLAREMLDAIDGVRLYWLWIGIPSILTLVGSAAIGWRLARSNPTIGGTRQIDDDPT